MKENKKEIANKNVVMEQKYVSISFHIPSFIQHTFFPSTRLFSFSHIFLTTNNNEYC